MKLLQLLTVCLLFGCIAGCKKDELETKAFSSVLVINAVIPSPNLQVGSIVESVASNWYTQFAFEPGIKNLYIWPQGDSSHPVFDQPVETNEGHIYSLFLTGEMPDNLESVWLDENFPVHIDSTTAVRFINLAPSAGNISVQLAGSFVHEFSDVEYKEITDSKIYAAKSENVQYDFEIINNETGNLLYTYTYYPARFNNVTIAITGVTPADPPTVFKNRINGPE